MDSGFCFQSSAKYLNLPSTVNICLSILFKAIMILRLKALFGLALLFTFSVYFTSCVNKRKTNSEDLNKPVMKIERSNFGSVNGETIYLYNLVNRSGMHVRITNYGGIVTSILVPDKNGKFGDVVLGFDSLSGYLSGHPYFGAIIGRYGNRIAKGEFMLDGETYTLARNDGENHLHGGVFGFDKKVWQAEPIEKGNEVGVKLKYTSVDMEEGYPGNLEVTVIYTLTDDNELKINYNAITDKACPVNLTHHGYFNLTAGRENVLGHQLKISAGKYVAVDKELIPTGELPEVTGTSMDFLDFHTIGKRIKYINGGYDHSYVLNKADDKLTLSVQVFEPVSKRFMEVYTTEPAIQFYTGNFLDGSLTGKGGITYNQHYGFCLEAQHFPDSPNRPSFPNTILRPGEEYSQLTVYKFSVKTNDL
jgi:aldose 1-epimerase